MSNASSAAGRDGRDLLFVSLEPWDDIWRRNQFLVAGWARRFPQRRVLFVGPPRRVGTRGPQFSPEGLPNVRVVRPPKLLPERLQVGRVVNRRAMRAYVKRAAAQWGLEKPLLWLNPYDAGHLRGRMGERGTVYDITDDWELSESDPLRRARVARFDRALCRRADLTVVCSEALAQSRRPIARRLLLLPNGVDAAHYAASQDTADKASDAPPVFGYTGTLHPERVDAGLIAALAHAYPQGRVLLIGPDSLDEATRAQIKALSNVELRGPVSYQELPQAMRPFDVCIVPHRESAFTESLNPIKLWEYLACGKPVASANVAGFRDYGALCHIGSGPEGFVAACREALREARPQSAAEKASAEERQSARQSEAAHHSWEARLDALLAELQKCHLLAASDE